ncbi:Thioredoxin-like domain-containing protein [Reichenbachiella faecimaris]|uniref:Thioredoxin-like domain-containing protein n=1 Tax=Reichenbachiella faecimaris TaxID=692418 RepID=A0A1W2GBB0_REIFA|nr:thioredoxin fold domain-containing protein [Reichenbachiella faecimaris]SMD33762.1 Thioredoxin-like domain-containing protein [Reichenbachiella faecimaris]
MLFLFVWLPPFFSHANVNNDEQINWNDLESAQTLSIESPRPIFIEFTAKWCGWCKKMEKTTFRDDKVIDLLNEKFYAVKVDFDSPTLIEFQGENFTGKQLAKHFGISGLPTMIYISSDQKNSETIVGYKTAKQLVKELNKLNQF